jgi:hypothetical protein
MEVVTYMDIAGAYMVDKVVVTSYVVVASYVVASYAAVALKVNVTAGMSHMVLA